MTMFNLDSKVALVTGAGSGLGRQFALTLANAGASVVLAARRREKLEETATLIQAAGGNAICIELDVTDSLSITNCLRESASEVGVPDILVNNAGIAKQAFLTDISEEDWNAVIDTNLKGAWLMTRELARTRKTGDSAVSVVNISSILDCRGSSHLSSYCASKAGLTNLTRALAVELSRFNIRVNAIAPGYVETDMNRDYLNSDAGDLLRKRVPLRRFGQAEDLDGTILYLCSNASRYVNGSIITVDGGLSAGM